MVFVLNICTQHHRGQKHISNSEEYTFINMDRKGIPRPLGFSHNNPEAIPPSTLPQNKENYFFYPDLRLLSISLLILLKKVIEKFNLY